MKRSNFRASITLLSMLAITIIAANTRAVAQTETVLYNFSGSASLPLSGVTFDASGNFYGTSNSGALWELSPNGSGGWNEGVAWNFSATTFNYSVGGLVADSLGNLYGTTLYGGAAGNGSVFKLSPAGDGSWTETDLYDFGKHDGKNPNSLVFDTAGNIFGTTISGGTKGAGTVFELIPQGDGTYQEKIVHNFQGFTGTADGTNPDGPLAIDAAGNLYGVAQYGGPNYCTLIEDYCGTLFELVRQPDGTYRTKVLHAFGVGNDGLYPNAGVILDSAGNIYGVTGYGGLANDGTVFEFVKSPGGGAYKERILHSFSGNDGWDPDGTLIFDAQGNLYGNTFLGGTGGVTFELMPQSGGTWKEKVVHSFGTGSDGGSPIGALRFGSDGNLYGATYQGGTQQSGTAFLIVP